MKNKQQQNVLCTLFAIIHYLGLASKNLTNHNDWLGLLQPLYVRRKRLIPLVRPESQPFEAFSGIRAVDVHYKGDAQFGSYYPPLSISVGLPYAMENSQELQPAAWK